MSADEGSGVHIFDGVVTLRSCEIKNNVSPGSAVVVEKGVVHFEDCDIHHNINSAGGNAVGAGAGAGVRVGREVGVYGEVVNADGTINEDRNRDDLAVRFTGCNIHHNEMVMDVNRSSPATPTEGIHTGNGGGVFIHRGVVLMMGCEIHHNTAQNGGGESGAS